MSEMAKPDEKNENSSPFMLSRKIYSIKTELDYSIWMVIVLFVWITVFAIAYMLGGRDWSSWAWDVIVFIGLLIWVIAAFSVRWLVRATRVLKDWKDGYFAYAHLIAFEFTPRKKGDVTEDVASKLMMVYPELEEEHKEDPDSIEYKATIEGKKSSHEFEAAVYGDSSLFLVKDKTSQTSKVDAKDLADLMGQANDITKKEKDFYLEGIVVVSSAGFTDKAVEYVSDKKNWVHPDASRRISLTLLQTTPEGYSVVWMPYPRLS